MSSSSVLIFGGYGVFGARLAADLLQCTDARVVLAGRNFSRARTLCDRLGPRTIPLACDMRDAGAVEQAVGNAAVVIVAAGPFQSLPLTALEAAIHHRVHYIDLADSRFYLQQVEARRKNIEAADITVLSALSTVSGISAVFAGWGAHELGGAEQVHIALSPGNHNPRGLGTIGSVLTSVGKPIQIWRSGQWVTKIGWSEPEKISFPAPIGVRRVYWIDGPDYDVLPRELGCQDVAFKSGLELDLINRSLNLLAWYRQRRPGFALERYTWLLMQLSMLFAPFGTEHGALRVAVQNGERQWEATVVAERDGPMVAATPAAVATERLLNGELTERGLIPLCEWTAAPLLVKELESRGLKVVVS